MNASNNRFDFAFRLIFFDDGDSPLHPSPFDNNDKEREGRRRRFALVRFLEIRLRVFRMILPFGIAFFLFLINHSLHLPSTTNHGTTSTLATQLETLTQSRINFKIRFRFNMPHNDVYIEAYAMNRGSVMKFQLQCR